MNEQTFNLNFVGEVEKYPILYNYTLPGYSRKDLIETAWREVGKTVKLSVTSCKEKWKNLRTVFVRNRKHPLCGSGAKKRKPYYLSEAMQFTLPFVKVSTKATDGNLPDVPNYEQDAFDDTDIEDSSSQVTASSTPPPSSTPSIELPSMSESLELIDQHSQQVSDSRPKLRPTLNQKRGADDVDKSFTEHFEDKRAKITDTQEQNYHQSDKMNAVKHFLLSLLPELEEMSDQQIKMFKRRTLLTIDDVMSQDHPSFAQTPFSPASVHSSSSHPVSDYTTQADTMILPTPHDFAQYNNLQAEDPYYEAATQDSTDNQLYSNNT